MEKNELYNMFIIMIRNAYNSKNIEDLLAIKKVIDLIPVKYIMDNNLTITQADYLKELIDVNIIIIKEEK